MSAFCRVVIHIGLAMLCLTGVATAQIELQRDSLDGQILGMAPPPPSPLRINGFRIDYSSTSTAPNGTLNPELVIPLRWDSLAGNVGYQLFRKITPLAQTLSASGFMAFSVPGTDLVSPVGWTVIGTPAEHHNRFTDRSVPPVNLTLPAASRRPFGPMYCYRLETEVDGRPARSLVVCTRIRGLNAPSLRVNNSVVGEVSISWVNNSNMAVLGYHVRHRETFGGAEQRVTLMGIDQQSYVFKPLKPNERYCFGVRAFDYYGNSNFVNRCFVTKPEPEPEPLDRTITVTLSREQVYDPVLAFVPYVGRFPALGLLPSGTLRKIELHAAWPVIFFVKPNHNTSECGDASAVVPLNPGESMTAAQMQEAFGSSTPGLPVVFVACIGYTPQILNWVPIKITYRVE